MSDATIRDLERAVLAGDAAALEKLKAAWLRAEALKPWRDELLGPAPNEHVVVKVECTFVSLPALDEKSKPTWSGGTELVRHDYVGRMEAMGLHARLGSMPRVYRQGETNGRAGDDLPDYDSGAYELPGDDE